MELIFTTTILIMEKKSQLLIKDTIKHGVQVNWITFIGMVVIEE